MVLRITPRARCCGRSVDMRRPYPNTRRRSRPISIQCTDLTGSPIARSFTGSIEEAIPLEEQAIRLSPRDAFVAVFYRQIGLVHVLQSRTTEAVVWLERARNASPAHPNIRAQLASAYALAGEPERAAAELAEARRLSGDDRFSIRSAFRGGIWRTIWLCKGSDVSFKRNFCVPNKLSR